VNKKSNLFPLRGGGASSAMACMMIGKAMVASQ
jgi:hypothetical protein